MNGVFRVQGFSYIPYLIIILGVFWGGLGACIHTTNIDKTPTPIPVIEEGKLDNLASSSIDATECPGAPPKRISVGDDVFVCTDEDLVLLRKGPDHKTEYTHRLVPGAELVVIGDPICDPERSFWYWQVRTESGYEGWIAEGGDNRDPYFICPVDNSD